jgi:hypothetical protein
MYAANIKASRAFDSIFYPGMGRPKKDPNQLEYCLDCPVRDLCLEDAIVHDERFGIWGGLSYAQRKYLYPTMRKDLLKKAFEENWLDRSRLSKGDLTLVARWEQQRLVEQQSEAPSLLELLVESPAPQFFAPTQTETLQSQAV